MAGTFYVRTEKGGNCGRQFPPLAAEHPLVTDQHSCAGCEEIFRTGDVTTLVIIGPGNDPDAQDKAYLGRVFNAVAVPVHYTCATGEQPGP